MERSIALNWAGESVDVAITMDVIDRIERRLKAHNSSNLMLVAANLPRGTVSYGETVTLFSELLNAGGLKVSRDDVHLGMFGGEKVDPEQVFEAIGTALSVIFPAPKKPEPARKAKPSTPKRATRGRKSTK